MAVTYKLYIDGQLGIPFKSEAEVLKEAKRFEKEGYDWFITTEGK